MKEKHDLGLIVPLGEEVEYVLSELDLLSETRIEGTLYHRFRIGESGVTGVLSVLYGMGQPNAALAAHDLLAHFDVPLIAVVGTAAALSDDVALGDVVLAEEIENYLYAAKIVDAPAEEGGWRVRLAGTSWKPSFPLCSYLHDYKHSAAGRPRVREWSERSLSRCRIAEPARPKRPPRYHVGPIATGDVVGAAAAFREELLAHNRKLAALEMEAGGAALSAYRRVDALDVLVARGVSDRAGADKSATDDVVDLDGEPNAWRAYAVRNAVNVVKMLFEAPDFPARRPPEPRAQRAASSTALVTAALTLPSGIYLGHVLGELPKPNDREDPPPEPESDAELGYVARDDSPSEHEDPYEFDFS